MIRIIIALILSLPIYGAVIDVSYWLIITVMILQVMAGLDVELFDD